MKNSTKTIKHFRLKIKTKSKMPAKINADRVQLKKIVQMIFMNHISIIYIIKQTNGSIRWLHSASE